MGPCEHGNKSTSSIKGGKFLCKLSAYQILDKNSIPRRQLIKIRGGQNESLAASAPDVPTVRAPGHDGDIYECSNAGTMNGRENQSSLSKTWSSAILPTTNPIWTTLGFKPGLCCENVASSIINFLSINQSINYYEFKKSRVADLDTHSVRMKKIWGVRATILTACLKTKRHCFWRFWERK